MEEFWRFTVFGLGGGSIYALIALGIVLVYRGSGVVNFANGALTLMGSGVYYQVVDHVGIAFAVVLGVLAAAVTGVVVNLAVMTPMRRASPLARVVATLGIAALVTEVWKQILKDQIFVSVPSILPTDPVNLFGSSVIVGQDRIWILAITVVLFAVMYAISRFTRFGLATSAVAESETVAAAQGWSPVTIATVNWFLAGGLAGFAGIVLAGVTGLSPDGQNIVIIPALAAALVGGFSSLPVTLGAALLIGVLESQALVYAPDQGALNGLQAAIPFLVILTILLVRGKALPLRSFQADRLPSVGTARINGPIVLTVALASIGSLWLFSATWSFAMVTTAVLAMVALSLVVVAGYAGQLSLMQWTTAGVGGLIGARVGGDLWGLPFLLAALVGVAFAIPIGLLVALPALRIRGVTLAVTTLALGYLISAMVLTNSAWTGGPVRGTVLEPPEIFGWSIDLARHPERYALVSICFATIAALSVGNLRRGRLGRRLIAVRGNERAAASVGVDVLQTKMYAFGISTMLAAAAGVLASFRTTNPSFTSYGFAGNINVVIMTFIGGIGWITGGIVAGVLTVGGLLTVVINHVIDSPEWYSAVAAFGLIVTVVFQPDGVVPKLVGEVKRLRPAKRETAKPLPVHKTELTPKALELRGLTVRFGAVTALDSVDIVVEPGQVVGLIGPNGAGKTTLIDAASGFVSHSGTVTMGGESMDKYSARQRVGAGLTRSFQSLELFEDLTVGENIRIACEEHRFRSYFTELFRPTLGNTSEAADAAIAEFELAAVLEQKPSELPYATRRLVAIARAVAKGPSTILLDEPAAGLDTVTTDEMATLIRRLATDWGMGILLVEHDMDLVMRTCDRIVVLNFGKVIARGTPEEIRENPAVIEAYLGHDVERGQSSETSADSTLEGLNQ